MLEFISSIPLIGSTLALIIPFIVLLSIVVFIHEYGHYIVGRWCGIGAETFSIGFGPVLASRVDKRGTKWQVAAIPLGGYVKFLGDEDAASTSSDMSDLNEEQRAQTLGGAKLYKRALTVLAGPVANFILSAVIFAGLLLYTGRPTEDPIVGQISPAFESQDGLKVGDLVLAVDGEPIEGFGELGERFSTVKTTNPTLPYRVDRNGEILDVIGPFPFVAIVGAVTPVSPASKAGMKQDDIIVGYAGNSISSFAELREKIFASEEKDTTISVMREGERLQLAIQPHERLMPDGEGGFERNVSIGVVAGIPFGGKLETPSILESATHGVTRVWDVVTESLNSIRLIITGEVGVENLSGPVGIAHVSGDIAKSGIVSYIALIAFISTAIGFLNLLPIPVLDGGHLVMFASEAITGRPPRERIIQIASMVAMGLLLTLMLFVTFNDIIRLALYWA